MPLAVDSRMTSIPSASGTACRAPEACSWAFFQRATLEPWKHWIVSDRPTPSAFAVPTR